jgi:predicted nucleotidyltransferase
MCYMMNRMRQWLGSGMAFLLNDALRLLKAHEAELRRRGVMHAAVFGSVARGQADPASDVDIVIELDPTRRLGLFEYAGLKLYIAGLFGVDSLNGPVDVVSRKSLKETFRDSILRDAVHAF